jgi:hypothetical protein
MTRTHLSLRSALVVVAIAWVMPGCGGGDAPTAATPSVDADPGLVEVRLTTPNTGDGAALLTISGGEVTAVESTHEQSSVVGKTKSSILVRGDLTTGVIARIKIPDRNRLASYSVTLDQVAAKSTYQQRSLQDYRVTLVKP